MTIPSDLPSSQPESFRYPVEDPETHGLYEIVSPTSLTPEQLQALIAEVIADEGRVRSGRKRVILAN